MAADFQPGTPGPRNLITDVAALSVGQADDARIRTGVTVVIPEQPAIAAVDVRGGGPGTRETDALGPTGAVEHVHAIVLSGGSAFGLSAATGVQAWLAERGIGFAVGNVRVPIVPQAILFDLLNGGDKNWGEDDPYPALAATAFDSAAATFALGSAGAGFGATTVNLRGGLGSASQLLDDGTTIGALAAVNPAGSVTIGSTRYFWASPFEIGDEFGGLGFPSPLPADALSPKLKGMPGENTTLVIVATDAALDKRQCHRLAVMAQTGLARAIYPVHTPLDGDVVFALSTGARPLTDSRHGLAVLGAVAANVVARAIARGVYCADRGP